MAPQRKRNKTKNPKAAGRKVAAARKSKTRTAAKKVVAAKGKRTVVA